MSGELLDRLEALMRASGLAGHEDPVRRLIAAELDAIGLDHRTDQLGNLCVSLPGTGPSVMLFTHMDQLGFIVRRIEPDGFLRLERLGGVPERALPAQDVTIPVRGGGAVPGVIGHKNHHATAPDEKYTVLRMADLYVDCGFASRAEAEAAGIRIGSPVTYAPTAYRLGEHRLTGTSIDDRAGCAVLVEVAEALARRTEGPPVHIVFSVQEEFNLRGVLPLAQTLRPDIALQIDIMLATDTPDMGMTDDMVLGGGPGISLYSFHGRGTLNGVIPHPALVRLMEQAATAEAIPLQRSARTGVLTDLSYVQHVGEGVAALDLGFPMRYSHAAREVVDLRDLDALARLLVAALSRITPDFDLDRNAP